MSLATNSRISYEMTSEKFCLLHDTLEQFYGTIRLQYEPHHEKICLCQRRTIKGADQLAHPCSLISAFDGHCLDCIIPLLAIAEISRLQIVSVAEQACFSLKWSQTPKTGFLVTWLVL